jgi:hypothetical protein
MEPSLRRFTETSAFARIDHRSFIEEPLHRAVHALRRRHRRHEAIACALTAQLRTALAKRSKYIRSRSSVAVFDGPRSNSTFWMMPLEVFGKTLA